MKYLTKKDLKKQSQDWGKNPGKDGITNEMISDGMAKGYGKTQMGQPFSNQGKQTLQKQNHSEYLHSHPTSLN